jgi:hypothetical protein
MLPPRQISRFFPVAGMVAIAISPTLVRAELSSTSPFLPPQGQVVAAPTVAPPLELRGINILENVTLFSIFDATAKKPAGWLKLNEAGPGFTIKSFDAASDTVTVDYQGRMLKLVMRTPKTAVSVGPAVPPGALPPQLALQTPAATVPRPAIPAVAPAAPATAAADAAKLKDWQEEIERRRTVRNQPAGTPVPPAVAPAATPPTSVSGPQPTLRTTSGGPVPSNTAPGRAGQ